MGVLDSAKPVAIVCTRDRERAIPFYRDTLGLRLASEDRFAAVFELGVITLRFSTLPDWKTHSHTILGFDIVDIDAAVKALMAKDVTFKNLSGIQSGQTRHLDLAGQIRARGVVQRLGQKRVERDAVLKAHKIRSKNTRSRPADNPRRNSRKPHFWATRIEAMFSGAVMAMTRCAPKRTLPHSSAARSASVA